MGIANAFRGGTGCINLKYLVRVRVLNGEIQNKVAQVIFLGCGSIEEGIGWSEHFEQAIAPIFTDYVGLLL